MASLNDYLIELTKNKYVKDVMIKQGKILYKPELYTDLNKLLKEGLGVVDAFNKLGFDTSILGEDRAYACAKRCKNYVEKADVEAIKKYLNNELSKEDYDKMNDRDKMAALEAKVLLYEAYIDYAKKNDLL